MAFNQTLQLPPSNRGRSLVVGALNVDHYYRVSDLAAFRKLQWWPRHGERTLTRLQRRELDRCLATSPDVIESVVTGGGQAGNVAVAMARCGIDVALLSKVGRDSAARTAMADLSPVDLTHLEQFGTTSEAFVLVDTSGARDILVWAPNRQIPDRIPTINWNIDYVHFTSLSTAEELQVQVDLAGKLPEFVQRSLDIGSLYAEMGLHRLRDLIRRVGIVFATDSEIELFTGRPWPEGKPELFAVGPRMICRKSGAGGAMLASSNGIECQVNAPAVTVVDTTGAGDVLAAVLIASLLNGVAGFRALEIAVQLASKSVTAWARSAYPTQGEFRLLLQGEPPLDSGA